MPLPLVLPSLASVASGAIIKNVTALVSKIGIKGKTPKLDWNSQNQIAIAAANDINRALRDAKYLDDPIFKAIYLRNQISFVNSENPSAAHDRARMVGELSRAADKGGDIWATIMHSLNGVSSNADDPTGAAWRVKRVIEVAVDPSIQEYLKAKGITPEEANKAGYKPGTTPLPTAPGARDGGPVAAAGAGVLLLVIAVVVLFFSKGK